MDEKTNDKRWCIYMHRNKVNGKVYIGQTGTSVEYRWCNGKRYKGCVSFNRAIEKYGWDNFDHIILADNLTYEEAEREERRFISMYDSTNPDKGYNLTSGGEMGKEYNDDVRRKMSESHADVSGDKNPRYGVSASQETRQKMSRAHRKRLQTDPPPMLGKHHTQETKDKLSKMASERMSTRENVYFYGKKHTEEAKKKMRENHSDVSGNKNPRYGKGKAVVQLTTDWVFVAEYASAFEAGLVNDVAYGAIYNCCKHKPHYNTSAGFKWMYKDEYEEMLTRQNDLREEIIDTKELFKGGSNDTKTTSDPARE